MTKVGELCYCIGNFIARFRVHVDVMQVKSMNNLSKFFCSACYHP